MDRHKTGYIGAIALMFASINCLIIYVHLLHVSVESPDQLTVTSLLQLYMKQKYELYLTIRASLVNRDTLFFDTIFAQGRWHPVANYF